MSDRNDVTNKTLFLDSGPVPPPDAQPKYIPDDHYAAVGKVSDAWADLEHEIDRLIWHLAGAPQVLCACITAQMISVHPRLQALLSLVHIWRISDATEKELKAVDTEIGALTEKRNRTIHDKRMVLWHEDQVVRFSITARRKLTFGPIVEEIAELEKTREQIYDILRRFVKVRDKIMAEYAALLRKGKPQFPSVWEHPVPSPNPATES